MQVSSGFKTSEFAMGMIFMVANGISDWLISQGIAQASDKDVIIKLATAGILAIVSVAIHISYTLSRTEVKKAQIEAQEIQPQPVVVQSEVSQG